jgi:hypothetical protein
LRKRGQYSGVPGAEGGCQKVAGVDHIAGMVGACGKDGPEARVSNEFGGEDAVEKKHGAASIQ